MADSNSQSPGLGEVAGRFLTELSSKDREASQQEVYRFVRWYGWERPLAGLTAPEIANFAERLSSSDTDYAKKLEMIRAFLVHAKKAGWSKTNLAIHLRTKKTKARVQDTGRRGIPEVVSLSQQGYAEMEAELADLKARRLQVIDEIRLAAADKDFRENAPLEAAREQHGLLGGRIRELEETLKAAAVIGAEKQPSLRAGFGDRIVLLDMSSGEELRYTIVHPKEVDPTRGKISSASPIGRAVIGRGEKEVVEVTVPAGKLRYQIKRVER